MTSDNNSSSGRYQWLRQRDMAYEAHQDAMRVAKMNIKWSGVAYYVCEGCHRIKSLHSFYIVPVYNEDLEMELQPMCDKCYRFYNNNSVDGGIM